MVKVTKNKDNLGVDKSLVAMFLKMSPEERLKSNDNAVRTILELRDGYQQQRSKKIYRSFGGRIDKFISGRSEPGD